MPELKCTVATCSYNQDQLCHLDVIEVGGNQAKNSTETRCDSFKERTGGSYTNAAKEPSERSSIKCQATDCDYNEQCKCHADKITVDGSNANTCKETACATFSCCG